MTYIASTLDVYDIFSLGLTCRQFNYFLHNENICRTTLESHAHYSAEHGLARSSGQFSRCFRRLVKTRQAIATATPYAAALLAWADDFVYCSGMLCYTVGPQSLRLLDLHKSADLEAVIDTRALLRSVDEGSLANINYKFRPVHYADGVLSCLYTPAKQEGPGRLIVVDWAQRKPLTCRRLESSHKIFVRNDRRHLYYGTYSMMGDDGFKRWVLNYYDIEAGTWASGNMALEDLVGSDVGSTICFEIIDNYFYGLSSLTSYDVYETDSKSHYYAFRFLVGCSRPEDMQLALDKLWRRDHEEGPIDDRWSTISLEKDPATGQLMIIECRKEYLVGDCSSTRTSYRTELGFSSEETTNDFETVTESETADEPKSPAERRNPLHVHRGDDASTAPAVTLTHCYLRSYHQACGIFLDLVNDPEAMESMKQRPQLRAMTRIHSANSGRHGAHTECDNQIQGVHQVQGETNIISWWPPKPDVDHPDPRQEALDKVLNPRGSGHYGPITGVMDDRSMVYTVGQRSSQRKRPLVFLSFDPAIRLPGLIDWPGGPATPSRTPSKESANACANRNPYPTPQSLPVSAPASRNTSVSEGFIPIPLPTSTNTSSSVSEPDSPAWGRVAPALYVDTLRTTGAPAGFNFAHCSDPWGSCKF
ncbi:hypothetical protein C8034_v003257 [Colletotrichum sidae]|uniref:F-box domain-containing protein n=1 Tax=Colletotrichum sidae TaxID=1347389 RepID=A0A4R8TT28_9PEZI|nr:hypothetical protein C8034_v003257 [Colletotrichum sidae]